MEIVKHVRDDGSVLLVPYGEIDMATVRGVRDVALDSLKSTGCAALTIDLHHVTFVDSTGVGALIAIQNVAHQTGQELTLFRPSARLMQVLKIAGLDTFFTIELETLRHGDTSRST